MVIHKTNHLFECVHITFTHTSMKEGLMILWQSLVLHYLSRCAWLVKYQFLPMVVLGIELRVKGGE